MHNSRGTQELLDSQLMRFTGATKALFLSPRSEQGTDIIGALLATEEEFAVFPEATSRSIILASNMANVDYKNGVILKSSMKRSEIDALLDRLETSNDIPDLRRACVYLVGAGRLPTQPEANDVQTTIRIFWEQYFARANARQPFWVSDLVWPLAC